MDFAYSEDQQAVAALARQILHDQVSDAYHTERDAHRHGTSPAALDNQLWKMLADAGLVAVGMSAANGGSGMGFIPQCLVLQELGAVLAPLPLLSTLLAAWALEQAGDTQGLAAIATGDAHLALSLADGLSFGGEPVQGQARLSGALPAVQFAHDAQRVVARVDQQLVVFQPRQQAVQSSPVSITSGLPCSRLELDAVSCELLGDSALYRALEQRLQVATAAVQLGVAGEALRRTAQYTTERQQFGRPLAAFQAVAHRAADGYIDIEALRAVLEGAMWRLDEGLEASLEAAAARWWACEVSHRVGHTAQHLHGGIGADLDYPIHRYFLWAKQLEFELPAATHQLAAMGSYLAVHNDSGASL